MAESGDGQQGNQPAGASPPAPGAEGSPGGAPSAQAAAAATVTRPDWLPEKFFDAKAGPQFEKLAQSYGELEKMRGKFGEQAKAEALAELRAGVPEKPDDYELKPAGLPDGVVWIEGEIPETLEPGKVYFKPDIEGPALGALKAWAHENGVKGEAFGKLLGLAAQVLGHRVPTPAEREQQRSEFFASLGENGAQRAGHLYGQLRAALPEAQVQALDGIVGNRAVFEAVEALVTRAGGARFAPANGAPAGALTEAALKQMMRDPRYADPLHRNDDFVRQVEEGWRTLYPGGLPSSHTGRAA